MQGNDFRRRANAVRSIPLETVLTRWGAERDHRDKWQWRTEHGPLSVTGAKFFNWHLHKGGGGAIDLVTGTARRVVAGGNRRPGGGRVARAASWFGP